MPKKHAKRGTELMSLRCDVCDVQVACEATMQAHLAGRKHYAAARAAEAQRQGETGVHVTPILAWMTHDHLGYYFSDFGDVENVYINYEKRFAIVTFMEPEYRQAVLQTPHHYCHSVKLVVRAAKPRILQSGGVLNKTDSDTSKQRPVSGGTLSSSEEERLMGVLHACESVEDQMRTLKRELMLQPEQTAQREWLMQYITDILQPHLPGCQLHPFGSSVNGFGIQGCDIDLYLDMNLDGEVDESQLRPLPSNLSYIKDFKQLRFDASGRVCRESLKSAPAGLCLKFISRVLVNEPNKAFTDLFAVPSSRCPVLKFRHQDSGIQCDLTVSNSLASRNTRLIRCLSECDERIPLMVYALRHWARKKDISGNGGPRLSSYALTWLIYFYLQNIEPSVLPTVETLAELAESKTIIEKWDCSFPADQTRFPKNENHDSLEQLLAGFFDFWLNVDFSTKMVCTRNSQLQEIKAKAQEDGMAAFSFMIMAVQDPFVKTHNVTGNINQKTLTLIVDQLQQASAKCKRPSFTQKSSDPSVPWGLLYLWGPSRILLQNPTACNTEEGKEESTAGDSKPKPSATDYSFQIEVPVTEETPSAWCDVAAKFIRQAYHEIFHFETEDMEVVEPGARTNGGKTLKRGSTEGSDNPCKRQKSDEDNCETELQSSTADTNQATVTSHQTPSVPVPGDSVVAGSESPREVTVLQAHSTAKYRLWYARKSWREKMFSLNFLGVQLNLRDINPQCSYQLEKDTSALILSEGEPAKNVLKVPFEFSTVVKAKLCDSNAIMTIHMYPIPPVKEFTNFYNMFHVYFKHLVQKCMGKV